MTKVIDLYLGGESEAMRNFSDSVSDDLHYIGVFWDNTAGFDVGNRWVLADLGVSKEQALAKGLEFVHEQGLDGGELKVSQFYLLEVTGRFPMDLRLIKNELLHQQNKEEKKNMKDRAREQLEIIKKEHPDIWNELQAEK